MPRSWSSGTTVPCADRVSRGNSCSEAHLYRSVTGMILSAPRNDSSRRRDSPPACHSRKLSVWSGDTVVKDEDGFLYFVRRMDDMIKSSGYRISPTEVEEVIYGMGLVYECAAPGIPHFDLGQAVVVACHSERANDTTMEAIIDSCREALPNYMVTADIIFRIHVAEPE